MKPPLALDFVGCWWSSRKRRFGGIAGDELGGYVIGEEGAAMMADAVTLSCVLGSFNWRGGLTDTNCVHG